MQSVGRRVFAVSAGTVLKTSAAALIGLQIVAAPQLLAQQETWLLGPGSSTGKNSKVVPTDCVENADGSVTCNTKIENPPGDTPARPGYEPFTN